MQAKTKILYVCVYEYEHGQEACQGSASMRPEGKEDRDAFVRR